jgi:hypothetical protein
VTGAHSSSRNLAIGALLLLVLAACGSTSVEPTPTPTPVMTVAGDEGEGQSDSGTDGEAGGEAEAGPDSGPISGSAECLVGTWAADHESFAGYLQDAFESSTSDSGIELVFRTGSGDLLIVFTADGSMAVLGEEFQVDVEIVNPAAQFTFFVNADGDANYAADDQAIAAWDFQYSSDASGEGVVLGMDTGESIAVINLTPDRLLAYTSANGFSYSVEEAPEESSTTPYTCQGDVLILGVPEFQPVLWNRVN